MDIYLDSVSMFGIKPQLYRGIMKTHKPVYWPPDRNKLTITEIIGKTFDILATGTVFVILFSIWCIREFYTWGFRRG